MPAAVSGSSASPQLQIELVFDGGFAAAGSHTLGGSGIGTSSVTGGVLQITSTTNVYYERPKLTGSSEPVGPGTYTVVYTILNYSSGTISITANTNTDLTLGTPLDGTNRSANGTYTEDLNISVPSYIGLRGQGASVVNSMQIDNLSIKRST